MLYETIKLEKGLYTTGKSFTQALEELDPSESYRGTALEGLDAYERQLKRFDIKVSGADCDTVAKFFKTTDSAALFPEFVARAVKVGMLAGSELESIIAATTYCDSLDYRSLSLEDTVDTDKIYGIEQGASLPETQIQVNDTLTQLKKYGTVISASYEAVKFQKLDIFAVALRRIGEQIMRTEFINAIGSIDMNNVEAIPISGESITYSDLVDACTRIMPYKLTSLVMNPKTYASMLKLDEFKDANAGLDFHGTGRAITPFGAEIVVVNELDDNVIMCLDKNYAIERVVAQDITTEFDKLIDRQLERAAVSTIVGFNPLFSDAVKLIKGA